MAEPAAVVMPHAENRPFLFPLTHLVHMAEEYAAGEGFPQWLSSTFVAHFSERDFLALNSVAWVAMALGALLASRRPAVARVYLPALSALVVVNALAHVVGSAVTGRYSPGAVSGVLLWLPLGLVTLRGEAARQPPGALVLSMALGVLLHVLATFLALTS